MKKQFWFTPNQIELIDFCLSVAKERMQETPYLRNGHSVACRFTVNRVNELLIVIGG